MGSKVVVVLGALLRPAAFLPDCQRGRTGEGTAVRMAGELRQNGRTKSALETVDQPEGRPLLAFGSPGGDAQDQWGLEFVLGHLAFGLAAQEAADAPTFQSLHAPSSFWPRASRPAVVQVEAGHDGAVVADLRARGHIVEELPAWSQGWACAVRITREGFFTAAASRRGRSGFASVR